MVQRWHTDEKALRRNGHAGTVINVDSANGVIDFEFNATASSATTGAAYFSIVLYDTLENVIVTANEEII